MLANFRPVIDWVTLNAPVAEVDYSLTKNVVLTPENGSKHSSVARVICTVPMQILKEDRMKFNSPLPFEMKNALDRIKMPPGFKIMFRMSQKFYLDAMYVGSIFGEVDDVTIIYDPLWGKDVKDLHVLSYLAVGHKNAGEMSELSDEHLANAAFGKDRQSL